MSEGLFYSNGTITNLGSFLPVAINDNSKIGPNTTGSSLPCC